MFLFTELLSHSVSSNPHTTHTNTNDVGLVWLPPNVSTVGTRMRNTQHLTSLNIVLVHSAGPFIAIACNMNI